MIKAYKDIKVIVLSFILSLFAISAEAKKSSDFDDDVVNQNTNYQANPTTLEASTEAQENNDLERQVPIAVMLDPNKLRTAQSLNVITKKARKTTVSALRIGPTVVSSQETNMFLDNTLNNSDNETDESQTASEDEENFERIDYTRDILSRNINVTPEIFTEVG